MVNIHMFIRLAEGNWEGITLIRDSKLLPLGKLKPACPLLRDNRAASYMKITAKSPF